MYVLYTKATPQRYTRPEVWFTHQQSAIYSHKESDTYTKFSSGLVVQVWPFLAHRGVGNGGSGRLAAALRRWLSDGRPTISCGRGRGRGRTCSCASGLASCPNRAGAPPRWGGVIGNDRPAARSGRAPPDGGTPCQLAPAMGAPCCVCSRDGSATCPPTDACRRFGLWVRSVGCHCCGACCC